MSEHKIAGRDGERQSSGTVLESADEIRRAIDDARNAPQSAKDSSDASFPSSDRSAETQLYRPRNRPPMAILRLHFDGQEDGQEIAVFTSPYVIGRIEGNLVVEHDSEISGRHAELVRQSEDGRHFWQLRDLKSTNGTFVRAGLAMMKDQQEIHIGSKRYRFETAESGAEPVQHNQFATRKSHALPPAGQQRPLASLVDVSDPAHETRFVLTSDEAWIGRDSRLCSIVLDDPMVSPRHARLYRDKKNRWLLANAKSLNGIWLRVNRIELGATAQFQIGEQRFSFRIL